jgi:signal transduction histidine kinase/DNA-binding response OmpR family regulator
MPLGGGTSPRPSVRFGLRGIAGRLMLAFATIAFCTILAAAAGFWSLWSVSESLGEVTELRLPTAVTSLALSRHVERVVAIAPRLLSAENAEGREQAQLQLAPEIAALQGLLEKLRAKPAAPTDAVDLQSVTQLIDTLRGSLNELTTVLVSRDQTEQQRLAGRTAVVEMRDEIGRLLATWSQVLAKQLAKVEAGAVDNISLPELSVQLRALYRSQELLNIIADRANASDNVATELTFGVLSFQATNAATALIAESAQIHPDLSERVHMLLDDTRWALQGDTSVFAQARLVWRSRKHAEALLQKIAEVSGQLSAAVDGVVSYTEAQAIQIKSDALQIRKTAQLTLVATVTLSLLAVIGIGAGYVHGHLLTRLKSVTGYLHRLAEGKLDIAVNHTTDPDEIGELARALAVMRSWLQDRKRLDAKLHAMNRDLDKQVQSRTSELQTANETQARVLAVLSHEIRSPLAGIIGVADMLDQDGAQVRKQEYLGALREGAKALLSVVNSVLDHARLQSGPLPTEFIECALPELATGVASLLRPQAESKGLALETLIAPEVPPRVRGDEGRLRQVLVNLVTNAVKFTETGRIVLRLSLAAPGRLRMEVEDTGIGVPEAARASLFVAYSQADASISRRFGGTGLGLAISRGLIEAMKGEIGYEPVASGGSLFWAEIPIVAVTLPHEQSTESNPETAAHNSESTSPELTGLRVLVVDDNPINCMVVRTQLEKLGHSAFVAMSGKEALALAAQQPLDAAVLDLHLPDMDGPQIALALRAMPSLNALPLVAATGETLPSEIERARRAGIATTLIKPFTAAALARALNGAVANVPPHDAPTGPYPAAVEHDAENEPLSDRAAQNGLAAVSEEFGSAWTQSFVATLRTQLHELAVLLDQMPGNDIEGYRQVAHMLRPSAAMLADTRLLMACENLSGACRSLDPMRVRGQADELAPLLRLVADELPRPELSQVA